MGLSLLVVLVTDLQNKLNTQIKFNINVQEQIIIFQAEVRKLQKGIIISKYKQILKLNIAVVINGL